MRLCPALIYAIVQHVDALIYPIPLFCAYVAALPPTLPPPSAPDWPRTCWAWGDPHIIPFQGYPFDAYGLGVRTLLNASSVGVMQAYSCPVRCELGNAWWFPCGAASAVAVGGTIYGTSAVIVGESVFIDGAQLFLSSAGELRTHPCPGCPRSASLTIRRIADDDPDFKTPYVAHRSQRLEDSHPGPCLALPECTPPLTAPYWLRAFELFYLVWTAAQRSSSPSARGPRR